MFVREVFTSVAKAFSRWFRPKKHWPKNSQKACAVQVRYSARKKEVWGRVPDLRKKLLAVFFQINRGVQGLPAEIARRSEGRGSKGLADICEFHTVDPEPSGAYSLFYPYFLDLWSQPIYYKAHFLVQSKQHCISMRPRFARMLSVISEGTTSSHEDQGVLRAIDTTHSSYFSSDSEELLSDSR